MFADSLDAEARQRAVLLNAPLWRQFLVQSITGVRRSIVSFGLGFTACLVVVFVVALLVSLLSQSPLIFLRLAELQNGEMDVTVSAGDWTGFYFMNYSQIEAQILTEEPYLNHAPRISHTVSVYNPKHCRAPFDPYSLSWLSECNNTISNTGEHIPGTNGNEFFLNSNETEVSNSTDTADHCFEHFCKAHSHYGKLVAIDSEKEAKMALGRDWKNPALPKGQCYLQSGLARSLGVKAGDVVFVAVHTTQLLGTREWANATSMDGALLELYRPIYIPFVVNKTFADVQGKFPSDKTSLMLIEYAAFFEHIARFIDSNIYPRQAIDFIAGLNPYHYADSVNVNFPSPRTSPYMYANYEVIQKNVMQWATGLFYKVGFNRLWTNLNILGDLRETRYISMFLGLILDIIIFILLFLSVLLIYSLLMVNVETRTFELGVLRMVGSTKSGIVMLLLIQAFIYAIPAWIVGLALAEGFSYWVASALSGVLGVPIPPGLTWNGLLWASGIGLLVPILASLLPIRAALSRSLSDSLDTRSSKTIAIEVRLERSDPTAPLSYPTVTVGLMLSVFGASVYYLVPLALLSMNLTLLGNIFFSLLIGIIFGLSLLSLNLQRTFEQAIVMAFFWWEKVAVRSLVLKNLIAHRLRNQKTTIMYSMSLGFIIFITVAYNLQLQTFAYSQQRREGVYLSVNSKFFQSSEKLSYLPSLSPHRNLLEEVASNHSNTVKSFAWITHDLEDSLLSATRGGVKLTNLGQLWKKTQDVFGVSPGIFETTLKRFLIVADSSVEAADIVPFLYSQEGSGYGIVGSLYKDSLGLSLDEDCVLSISFKEDSGQEFEIALRFRPVAFMDSAPGFDFSPFPIDNEQTVLISLPTFLELTGGLYESVEDLPLRRFLLEIDIDAPSRQIDALIRDLNEVIRGAEAYVWDYRSAMAPLEASTDALSYVFSFTTVVAMAICFFSLTSSMFTNIYEQTKEIAVLRALGSISLGISKWWMYRVYIYEAFVLVFSASVLGMGIGLIVSYTMTLQQILFTQLPVPFAFPWEILLIVFVSSIFFAVVSSLYPIYRVLSLRVVQIFRVVA